MRERLQCLYLGAPPTLLCHPGHIMEPLYRAVLLAPPGLSGCSFKAQPGKDVGTHWAVSLGLGRPSVQAPSPCAPWKFPRNADLHCR